MSRAENTPFFGLLVSGVDRGLLERRHFTDRIHVDTA